MLQLSGQGTARSTAPTTPPSRQGHRIAGGRDRVSPVESACGPRLTLRLHQVDVLAGADRSDGIGGGFLRLDVKEVFLQTASPILSRMAVSRAGLSVALPRNRAPGRGRRRGTRFGPVSWSSPAPSLGRASPLPHGTEELASIRRLHPLKARNLSASLPGVTTSTTMVVLASPISSPGRPEVRCR